MLLYIGSEFVAIRRLTSDALVVCHRGPGYSVGVVFTLGSLSFNVDYLMCFVVDSGVRRKSWQGFGRDMVRRCIDTRGAVVGLGLMAYQRRGRRWIQCGC